MEQQIISFKESDFIKFVVTGKLYRSNGRFRSTYSSWFDANCINLWNGSIWGVLPNGKRKLLKRVYN